MSFSLPLVEWFFIMIFYFEFNIQTKVSFANMRFQINFWNQYIIAVAIQDKFYQLLLSGLLFRLFLVRKRIFTNVLLSICESRGRTNDSLF